jgi:hypothetical protein
MSTYEDHKEENLIYEDTIAQAAAARAKYLDLFLLFDPQQAEEQYQKARAIHRRIKMHGEYVHEFFSSDSNSESDSRSRENQDSKEDDSESDELADHAKAIVINRIKTAFSAPVVESVVGPQRAEYINQILAEERRKKEENKIMILGSLFD